MPKISLIKISILLFFLILIFGLFVAEKAEAASATIISISPAAAANGYIPTCPVIVTVQNNGCEDSWRFGQYTPAIWATIDAQNCSGGGNSFSCNHTDGAAIITVFCNGGTSDSRTVKLDCEKPFLSPITIKAEVGKGSIVSDNMAEGVSKLVGYVILEVTSADQGTGVVKVEFQIGTAGIDEHDLKPTQCGNWKRLPGAIPNPVAGPRTDNLYQSDWNTQSVDDERYYCVKAKACDKNNNCSEIGTAVVVNNKCDQDNDGFVSPAKVDATCKRVVCNPSDYLCNGEPDCNDDRSKGGAYARPYGNPGDSDYREGLFSPRTFYLPTCLPRNSCPDCNPSLYDCATYCSGCPACDDEADNDCDGSIDASDTNCVNTCDKDNDGFFNIKCLRPENWAQKGDCDDNNKYINFQFKEDFGYSNCVNINCCNDGKDNDCDGKIDECNWGRSCDKDGDKYISISCSPPDKNKPLPEGFLGWYDCDDDDSNVYPSLNPETEYVQGCDGTKDNNCDGKKDEVDSMCVFRCDKDGDGYFTYYDRNYEWYDKDNTEGHGNEDLKLCGGKFEKISPPSTFTARKYDSGEVNAGTHYYKITFVTPRGETEGSQSVKLTLSNPSQVKLEYIPTGDPNEVTARRIYRTNANGSEYKLVDTIGNNVWNYYYDNTPDSDLADEKVPVSNTTSNNAIVAGGKQGPDGRQGDMWDNDQMSNPGKKEILGNDKDDNGNGWIDSDDPTIPISIEGGLVPCGGPGEPSCTICHFFYMLSNIITFLRNLSFVIAPVFIVAAGILFVVAAGNPQLLNLAKDGIKATIIGVCIVLLAWLIISMIFMAVGQHDAGQPWYQVDCG